MKVLHVYPAIAVVCDGPRLNAEPASVPSLPGLIVWRNRNVYLDTADRCTRFKEDPRGTYAYPIQDGLYAICGSFVSDEALDIYLREPLKWGPFAGKSGLDAVQFGLAQLIEIARDPEGYTDRAKEAVALKNAAAKVERERRAIERSAMLANQRAAGIEKAIAAWMAGDSISWDAFEELCLACGVDINIRTMGACRRNVSSICRTSLTIRTGSKPNPWPYVSALNDAMGIRRKGGSSNEESLTSSESGETAEGKAA